MEYKQKQSRNCVVVSVILVCLVLSCGCAIGQEPKRSSEIEYINPEVPNVKLPDYKGVRYNAKVPDTLDLAERATLAINGLTGPVDPTVDYEIYWAAAMHGNKPIMSRDLNHQVQLIMQRSVPLNRLMSGSSQSMDVEKRWLEVLFQMQAPNGMLYYPLKGREKWIQYTKDAMGQYDAFKGEHYTGPLNNGWSAELFGLYYELTGNPKYKIAGQKLVDGLAKLAIHKIEPNSGLSYAYIPRGIYGLEEMSGPNASIPSEASAQGKNLTMGWVAYGLVKFYKSTGYQPALELAGEFVRLIVGPSKVYGDDGSWISYNGHLAWNAGCLYGVLEYACATGDQELLQWVRRSFEHGKWHRYGDMLTGFFPEGGAETGNAGEICAVSFMINLALKLSTAGVADYWDDVDRWTRNHFIECQLTSCDWMCQIKADQPELPIDPSKQSYDKVGEKNIGNFASWPSVNDWTHNAISLFMHCCSGEGATTLYRVWDNILNYKDGKLKVNLLLNRASIWADIDSYIPYEGRVDVKIKKANELSIRIPEWVKPGQVRCVVNDKKQNIAFEGRYAVVGKVKSGDVVSLAFPISERTEKVKIQGAEYTLTIKGNDVVHIEPQGKYHPLYQRDKYRQNKVQWKDVERVVFDKDIDF